MINSVNECEKAMHQMQRNRKLINYKLNSVKLYFNDKICHVILTS